MEKRARIDIIGDGTYTDWWMNQKELVVRLDDNDLRGFLRRVEDNFEQRKNSTHLTANLKELAVIKSGPIYLGHNGRYAREVIGNHLIEKKIVEERLNAGEKIAVDKVDSVARELFNIEYNQDLATKVYESSKSRQVMIGKFVKSNVGVCIEMSILAHLGLASLGIESQVVMGTDWWRTCTSHAWVESANILPGKKIAFEATSGNLKRALPTHYLQGSIAYPIGSFLELARPA